MYPNVIHKSTPGVNGGEAVDGLGCAMHMGPTGICGDDAVLSNFCSIILIYIYSKTKDEISIRSNTDNLKP